MSDKWPWETVFLYAVSIGAIAGGIVNWKETVEKKKEKANER